jgi:hypothetical protein
MKFIFAFVMCVAAADVVYAKFDMAWMTCKTSSDCAIAQGQCGQVQAANKKFLHEFEMWAGATACDAAIDFSNARKKFAAECINDKCYACKALGSKGRCRGL